MEWAPVAETWLCRAEADCAHAELHPRKRGPTGRPGWRLEDPVARFERKVIPEPTSGCWLWMGCLHRSGYGSFKPGRPGLAEYAHRFSYELHVGPIPAGLQLDHLCRNRACVNPRHLEPVTAWENWRRGRSESASNLTRTHCRRGHPLAGDNLYLERNRRARRCRTCGNEKVRQYVKRKRATAEKAAA